MRCPVCGWSWDSVSGREQVRGSRVDRRLGVKKSEIVRRVNDVGLQKDLE